MTTTDNRALATVGASPSLALQLAGGNERRLKVLKDVIAKGCTDEELEVFAAVAQRTKLDPFAAKPQIYAIKRWDGKAQAEVLTIQTSIDGFRLIAQRSGRYAGQAGPFWCGPDGKWVDLWLSDEPPAAARVGVRLRGEKEPTWGVAVWKRAKIEQNVYEGKGANRRLVGTKLSPFWEKMPAEMLAIAAERNAIRRACPQDTYDLELADPAVLEELQAERQRSARQYEAILGDQVYDIDPHTVEHAGRTIDGDTGEVLEDDPREFAPEPESEAPPPTPAAEGPARCADCGATVMDQMGHAINDNQRQLLLERFGKVLCRTCRRL